MSQYLFVYGTLDPEHAPPEIAVTVAKLRPVGKGSVQGVLYDLGDYPGAVFDTQKRDRIPGRVLRLPEDPEVLRELDEYEGYMPSNPKKSLFVRELRPVKLANGPVLRCWAYAYNRPLRAAPVIPGRVHRRKRYSAKERQAS
jgi:gamma-glutamylcyclotransferase (GGCT)/AIG2-like uncharacterized protein YtfP